MKLIPEGSSPSNCGKKGIESRNSSGEKRKAGNWNGETKLPPHSTSSPSGKRTWKKIAQKEFFPEQGKEAVRDFLREREKKLGNRNEGKGR